MENATGKIPRGPLGFLGNGNALGAVNYFTVATVNGIIPIAGVDIGYNIEGHSVRREGDVEHHNFTILATNENVAKFAAKFKSKPSNVDLAAYRITIESVSKVRERRTFTVWEINTLVEPRSD